VDSGFTAFFQQLPSIFIIIFCGSGALLLAVIAYLVAWRRQKAQEERMPKAPTAESAPSAYVDTDFPDLDDLLKPAPVTRSASGTFRVRLAEGGETEVAEVFTVLRDLSDGGLIVQIADKAYRHPAAGADTEFRRRFETALRDLDPSAATSTAPADSAAPPASESVPSAPPPAVETPRRPMQTAPPPSPAPDLGLPDLPDIPLPGDLPKFRMPEKVEPPKRGRIKSDRTPVPEINIAASIEAFLQHKLSMTGDLAGRSIHVSQSPQHGGVLIEVDGTFFEAVADITDDVVRNYIAATIQEWQDRQV
jgi:hypothetical protein